MASDQLQREIVEHRRAEGAITGRKVWLPVACTFVLLCILAWLDEVLDLPHLLLGAPQTPINWREAISETALIAIVGFFTVARLIHNVTERKRAEEALREGEERFRAIFETAKDSIFIKDRTLKYTVVNPAMESLFGLPASKLIGQMDEDLFGEETGAHIREVDSRVLGGETVEEQLTKPVKGIPTAFHIIKVPMYDSSGEIIGLCGIARDLTERERAEEETRQRTAQLEALREIGLELTAQLDLDALLHSIVSRAIGLLRGNTGGLDLYRPERDVLEWSAAIGSNIAPVGTILHRGEGLSGKVWETGKPLIVDDYQHWEGRAATWEGYPISAIVGAPVRWGEEFLGVLIVHADSPRVFSPADADLLSMFATQAAVAIRNARLYEETQSRSKRLAVVNRVASAVSATLHLDDLMKTVYREVNSVFQADAFFIALYEEETDELDFHIRVDEMVLECPDRHPLGAGLVSLVVTQKKPLLIRDWAQEQDHLPSPRLWGTMRVPASWLGVPMLIGERVMGVICVQAYRLHAYSDEDQLLLSTIADQVAVAVENARLFQAEWEQRELAEALEEAADAISRTLDLDQVLDRILEQVERVVAGDAFNIMLVKDGAARMVRQRGYNGLGVARRGPDFAMRIADYPSLQRMVRAGEPVVIPDTLSDPDWVLLEDHEWLRSYIGAPIQVSGVTVGFLNVNGSSPGQFGPTDALRLQAFANHVATAIENAQLYRELRNYAGQLEQRVQERTAQLQAQYARLEAILRSASDGIVVADTRGGIIQANPVTQTWYTRTLSPEDAARLQEAVRDLARRAEERPEAVLELTGLDLELKAAPISPPSPSPQAGWGEGEQAAAVVDIHDVSHLKALDRIKSRFIENVAHELRTPVTTIKLHAYLIRQQPGKWEKYLGPLAQEADHQARLVEDILQIARIDAGRLGMDPRPTSLNELTEAAVANHQALAQERGLTLEHRPSPPLRGGAGGSGPVALVDPERMMQVLTNLLRNAIQYTPEGDEVVVSTGREEAEGRVWATVTVADTGIGIPEQELPHIFERFFRGEWPRQIQVSGTGLGLAIVKGIVELHGGRVTVESPSTGSGQAHSTMLVLSEAEGLRAGEEGVGTTFTVWLPLAKGQA